MDPLRRKRLEELRAMFEVTEEYGSKPTKELIFKTIADDLNREYGRQVVVPRERKAAHGRSPRDVAEERPLEKV